MHKKPIILHPTLTDLQSATTGRLAPRVAHRLEPWFHLARWCLTCIGLKGDRLAGDAVELMGENPQVVLGPCDQIRHCNGGLLFHAYNFHRLVALETQERGQSHSRGCGLCSTVTAVLTSKDHVVIMLCSGTVLSETEQGYRSELRLTTTQCSSLS